MDKLKFIKFVVFVLTFLIVFGTLAAGSIIYKQISAKNTLPPQTNLSLQQPLGSFIADYKFYNDKMYLLIKGKNISDRIVILDPLSQKIISTLSVNQEN